ncbi:MAG TPA: nucleotidyl transferase AbiEii/AbiGii toxin family protein [Opitutaceae bacterium]|nr:nucleotidyl transferase AbiEii/AbiGii toxin family protein [Opitutaceae bacterium]
MPASVRQRLLNLSKERKEPFDLVLVRYGIERLLYRLSRSRHADKFLLKGAMLFALWSDGTHRPTRDVDLLGFGPKDEEELKAIFVELCRLETEPDGLTFLPDSVAATPIREEAAYPGTRVTLEARLENARIPLQVDIGFGDVVTPAPEEIDFPALLDFPAPHLRAYPIYTVVAEKLEASVRLGEANTRMKDFFDLWFLSRKFPFEGELLKDAVTRTFARRQMALPATVPVALAPAFATLKAVNWAAFLRRNALAPVEMTAALDAIRAFAWPVMEAATKAAPFNQSWTPGRGWHA